MGERFLLSKDEPLTPNIDGVMALWMFWRRPQTAKNLRKLDLSIQVFGFFCPRPLVRLCSSFLRDRIVVVCLNLWVCVCLLRCKIFCSTFRGSKTWSLIFIDNIFLLSVWDQLKMFLFYFHFLCLIWHVIKRYGRELSTVQRWASNAQYWWSYGTLIF